MPNARVLSLKLDDNGSYLGMEKGCFVLKDKKGNVERYPVLENQIKEVVLQSGNAVSTGALSSLGFWGVDVVVETARGRPVAMMKAFDDDRHVETRLAQYEAVNGEKGRYITKQIVIGKLRGQHGLLVEHGLKTRDLEHEIQRVNNVEEDSLTKFRQKLNAIEGRHSRDYFKEIFALIPEDIRPDSRKKYRAFDGVNNLFNLGYEVLQWKVHRALVRAYLEPYLGFLHSLKDGMPSLVCDMEELYRHRIDQYVLSYVQDLTVKDFIAKTEDAGPPRKGKRLYLNNTKTNLFMKGVKGLFKTNIKASTIRARGKTQWFETLVNEEALLLGKYLRGEKNGWVPRDFSLS